MQVGTHALSMSGTDGDSGLWAGLQEIRGCRRVDIEITRLLGNSTSSSTSVRLSDVISTHYGWISRVLRATTHILT